MNNKRAKRVRNRKLLKGAKHEGNFKSFQRILKQIEIASYQCQTLENEQSLRGWLDCIIKSRERRGWVWVKHENSHPRPGCRVVLAVLAFVNVDVPFE